MTRTTKVGATSGKKADPQAGRVEALRLIALARRARSASKRLALAHQALAVWPDCAQAYRVLLDNYEPDSELAIGLLRLAIKAARQAMGERKLATLEGRFSTDPEAYELLDLQASLSLNARVFGDLEEAIDVAAETFDNDPTDPLRVRFLWVSCLLESQVPENTLDAYELIQESLEVDDEPFEWWLYYRALVLYQLNGDNRKSREALAEAFQENPLLAVALLANAAIEIAKRAGVNLDPAATIEFAAIARPAWSASGNALDWLSGRMSVFTASLEDDRIDDTSDVPPEEPDPTGNNDPREKAGFLTYLAATADSKEERQKFLDKALAETDDSPVTYFLSALLESVPSRKFEFYSLAKDAARRLLGGDPQEGGKDLWKDNTGKDYLMAAASVAYYQWVLGNRLDAINSFVEVLSLNPADDLHVLPLLHVCYLEKRTPEAAHIVRERARREITTHLEAGSDPKDASLFYNLALSVIQSGDGPDEDEAHTRSLVEAAISENPYIPPLLLGDWEMPRSLPTVCEYGEYTEAIDYVSYAKHVWSMTPGALELLRSVADKYETPDEPDFVYVEGEPTRRSTIRDYLGME